MNNKKFQREIYGGGLIKTNDFTLKNYIIYQEVTPLSESLVIGGFIKSMIQTHDLVIKIN
jgi:hypothetical protein